eukprot:TRINITY_DN7625_c0_g1_i1.p1 TRINITY_DN7625_c0_g1~~TRINITY_DN7625_c0_g1_i1.p1  ORF type:complete len:663 (-),score=151.54 TRINITY_DN7625_c0_g1_i1:70-2058(-)
MAACNGYTETVKLLLDHGADANIRSEKGKTALFHAALNAYEDIVELLLPHCGEETLNEPDNSGHTPLMAACLHPEGTSARARIVASLLSAGADIDAAAGDGSTALHISATRHLSPEVVRVLLKAQADTDCVTAFGSTPLLEACGRGRAKVVTEFISLCADKPSVWAAQDYDGMTVLHACVRALRTSERQKQQWKQQKRNEMPIRFPVNLVPETTTTDALQVLGMLLQAVNSRGEKLVNVNGVDYGDGNVLHTLVWTPLSEGLVKSVEMLLLNKCDVTAEYEHAWTPLHILHNCRKEAESAGENQQVQYCSKLIDLISSHCPPDFLEKFDPNKPRVLSNEKYEERKGPENRIPPEIRRSVLFGDVSVTGLAKRILAGPVQVSESKGRRRAALKKEADRKEKTEIPETPQKSRVVVLVGAGVSVNAGLPDFRGQQGIYKQEHSPLRDAFSLECVLERPKDFAHAAFSLFGAVFRDELQPTLSHKFLKLLDQEGYLLRVFTQNIDLLEEKAGISPEKIVYAHGNLKTASCAKCGEKVTKDYFWKNIEQSLPAFCPVCQGPVRPDIVFFGEPLSSHFLSQKQIDFPRCDILIVMGTTLSVYPFAGLVNEVGHLVPRLLLNKEAVGPFAKLTERKSNFRDLAIIDDCDKGVLQLAESLGIAEKLLAM